MTGDTGFRREQRRVAAGMVAALLISAGTIAAALAGGGPALPAGERVALAMRADVFVAVWLAAAVANVARLRFFSAHDIAGSGMSDASGPVRTAGAVLQNTLEQVVLAVIVHAATAAVLPATSRLVAALVVLFGVGRACFWIGYRRGAAGRAFGFALTFYPTALTLLLLVLAVATGWRPQG